MSKSLTLSLAAGVSLLTVTAAFAQTLDNTARIEQDGVENAAAIDQAGLGNSAGTEDLQMLQNGFGNELTIDQTGRQNRIGTLGTGLVQNNILSGTAGINTADITQDGDLNSVNEVFQQISGAVAGNGNTLVILQDGDDNTIDLVRQSLEGGVPGQSVRVTIEGDGNRINEISQSGETDLRSEENSIFVLINGSNNGTQALRGVSQLSTITRGRLIQTSGTEDTGANGNVMQLEIQGNDTAFGIVQRGRGNRTGLIAVTGDANAIGIDQDGLDNDLTVGLIAGSDNEIGISQYGTNRAILNLLGNSDRNSVLIDQMGTHDATVIVEGNSNTLAIAQDYLAGLGGTNRAEVTVIGSENAGDIRQEGQDNVLAFTVEGDFNNRIGSSFSASTASQGLVPGRFVQSGSGNSFDGRLDGDANLAAFLQQGNLNSIFLTVSGTENEAILRQLGNGNSADLSQTGRANVAVVLQ